MDRPQRKRPAEQLVYARGNSSIVIFVTVCTKKRKPILARADVHERLVQTWRAADHWAVGHYVILPDHIHLFCAPASDAAASVRKWIAYWKSMATRTWPRAAEKPLWQAQAWDTQLRSGESYSAKWEYVRLNPVRHGLVESPDAWPYQGELNALEWRD